MIKQFGGVQVINRIFFKEIREDKISDYFLNIFSTSFCMAKTRQDSAETIA